MSISIRPFPERAKEFLKKNPQSKVYWGVVAETDAMNFSMTPDEKGYVRQLLLDTHKDILEVHLAAPAKVWFTRSREVWVIGTEHPSGIIIAQMVLFPDSHQVLELVKDKELYMLPISILLVGVMFSIYPFSLLFDFLFSFVPGGGNLHDLSMWSVILGLGGLWIVYSILDVYTPLPITLDLSEWLEIEQLICPLEVYFNDW